MGKAVKKIAKIAVPIALGFAAYKFGGPLFSKFMGPPTYTSSYTGGFLSGASKFKTALQVGGAGLKVYSSVQSQKYAGEQSSFMREAQSQQNLANEQRNRYNQMLQNRRKQQVLRETRYKQSQVESDMVAGGVGSGTSSGATTVGSTGTMAGENIGNYTLAADLGNTLTGLGQNVANAQTSANQAEMNMQAYNSLGGFGTTLFNKSDEIINFGGKLKSIFT